MKFSIKTLADPSAAADCVLVPVLANATLSSGGKTIDKATGGALTRAIASGDLNSKPGNTLLLHGLSPFKRVVLVAMGDEPAVGEKPFADAVRAGLRAAGALAAHRAASLINEAAVGKRALNWKLRQEVLIARELSYRFDQLKSQKEKIERGPTELSLLVPTTAAKAASDELDRAVALADGIDLTKDLGNLPGNICTPTYLADQARKLAKQFKLRCEVLDEKQMRTLKMGSLLSVTRGSALPPHLIVLEYRNGGKAAPFALVGKGITFDTGGISLKPAAEMDEMKYDMSGAGSVLGTLRAVAAMKLKINVIGVIPTCENMPSGTATRPGDIVTSMSGQTIEILNTDAEGRLILCDALTYVQKYKPQAIIDIATLTGACVIALGHHHSGLFSNDDALADQLLAAGREAMDTTWRMPLDDAYQEQLKSPFADIANIGGRAAGSVTAACFLARFAKGQRWAHLDIAGTAWKSGAAKGSSGRPVGLLTQYLISRAGNG